MNLEGFHADLLNEVELRAELDNEYMASAFMHEMAERMSDAEEIESLEVIHFRGTGARGKRLTVDGYDLDDPDGSIALAVSHFTTSPSVTTLSGTETKQQLGQLQAYLHDAVNGTFAFDREEADPAFQLAEDLRARGRTVTRYRLYLFSDAALSGSGMHLPSSDVNGVPVDFHVWDLTRLHQLSESGAGREQLDIDLTEWVQPGLAALEIASEDDFTTYLAAVPGALLADLYGRHGSRLLESNVRSYLSARGAINKGIRTTVLKEPDMFLAFNNGITATATDVKTSESGQLTAVRDLQIVNGGQTTASLFYVRRDSSPKPDLSGLHVQMKLVVVNPERARDLVPSISRYANSQNRVSEADFFSNHPFHVRMEELSRRLLVPPEPGTAYQTKWFYERTRGQYQNEKAKLSRAEQRKFEVTFPRAQVITKTDAAKYAMSWLQQPHRVSAGAQKNFVAFAESVADKWTRSSDEFNESYFKDLVAKALVFQTVRGAAAKAEWYESGYLANIVAYAVAKLVREVQRQQPGMAVDLSQIWAAQEVPEPLVDQLVTAARLALAVLTSETRPVTNVTEWAKREACWKAVEGAPLPLTAVAVSCLVHAERQEEHRRTARQNQKIDSGIAAQAQVLDLPPAVWAAVRDFGRSNRLLTPTDDGCLQLVTGGRGGFPSERQSQRLLKLLDKVINHGFVPPGA